MIKHLIKKMMKNLLCVTPQGIVIQYFSTKFYTDIPK